ncbi:hypothetical protein SAMN05421788_106279 [Filimonas lacunae]|uniref:Response regulatory domain-containing protein n=1 Tax=Filimonas lacunae TaxID=477680 RepID=A0A173MF30_9BACT|nr:hypothetical protein [Filimonas lacunae]BAV06212.1 hypothetical protein FLA_2228 [Filimonas lacunae]SIT25295.1 hypothetical protein SAMN05421788_106279 [Filimonas lacunae]
MSQKEILIAGIHPDIVQTVVRLINSQPNWNGTGAIGVAEAKALCTTRHFDVVLFGGGIEEADEQQLTRFFTQHHPKIICLRHYGGGSGLLYAEIHQALAAGS